MKYHISIKFIAILLATVFLAAAVGSAVGIFAMVENRLYERTVEDMYSEKLEGECHNFAVNLAHRYASLNLGGIPEAYLEAYWGTWWLSQFRDGYYFYTIQDGEGHLLESTVSGDMAQARSYVIEITNLYYRQVVETNTIADGDAVDHSSITPEYEPFESATSPSVYSGMTGEEKIASEDTVYNDIYYDARTDTVVEISYRRVGMERCTVTMYLLDGALDAEPYWDILRMVYVYRYDLIWTLGVGLLLFAVCAVYLCCAAGRKPGREAVRAEGLNRLPLDIYLGVSIGIEVLLIMLGVELCGYLLWYVPYLSIPVGMAVVFAGCLLFVAFCFAFAAQVKMDRGFWWRNCVIGRFLRMVYRCLKKAFRGCAAFFGMMPVIWQGVLTLACMGFVLMITYLLAFGASYHRINGFFFLLLLAELVLCIVYVCYCAYAFGVLQKGAANMAKGELRQLVPTKYLIGPFRTFAWELNRLSGAVRVAAEQQLKSERMKTELITNVSHDIKTPLTSIINYVDLLEKPHTEEEGAEYLTVLSRQSQRLKKLIDDLMDMSKASTGNMAVELQQLDAGEVVNQALGEFADKLEKAGLIPVVCCPEKPVYVLADGRHVWRVMSNLLSNAVKYALPGTRLYIDVAEQGGKVQISLKNISREALNVSADELAERFVRGDTSRNTEGSGLGLNIAKSLMELQQGKLELTVDGDLFKVTLIFPAG